MKENDKIRKQLFLEAAKYAMNKDKGLEYIREVLDRYDYEFYENTEIKFDFCDKGITHIFNNMSSRNEKLAKQFETARNINDTKLKIFDLKDELTRSCDLIIRCEIKKSIIALEKELLRLQKK